MVVDVRRPLRRTERGVRPLNQPTPGEKVHAVDFRMVTCEYNDKDGSIVMRGRQMDETSLQVRLTGFEYYFYIQRQTPFASDEEMKKTLDGLEVVARSCSEYTTPVQGRLTETETRYGLNEWTRRTNPRIHSIQRADGVYRTMYGYTPEGTYLDGLMRVYVTNYRYARHLAMVCESDQYFDFLAGRYGPEHKMALRTFGADTSPDALFCVNHEVTRGGYCRLIRHVADPVHEVYADQYYLSEFRNLHTIPDPPTPIPLSLFSFDIECIGKPNGRGGMTFPIAKVPRGSNQKPDPVVMIACIQNRYGKERHLEVNKAKVLVWPHPSAAPLVRKPEHARRPREWFEALPKEQQQTLAAVYSQVDIEEVPSQAHLLRAFVDTMHSWRADVVTGWNTDKFDYPYLFHIWEYLWRTDPEAREVLGSDRPHFGMSINSKSWCRQVTLTSKASGTRQFDQVSLPHVLYADGQVVCENPSYGLSKMESFKLDRVASSLLVYPGTKRPQRKIKFPLARSIEIWKGGGAPMWFFSCYCFVDALLPLQILSKFDKIGLMFSIANITYCKMNKIYNNGMQVKAIAIIQRAAVLYKGGVYLVPDYGRRHLHWPGVFLHPNVRAKVHEYADQFKSAPDKVTNYPGAKVIVPKAGYYPVPVFTDDFKSLYPTSANNYGLSYDTMLTPEIIEYYGVRAHEYITVPLGPRSLTWCGYPVEDPAMAKAAGYTESTIMMSYWMSPREVTFFGFIIEMLFALRKGFRKVEAQWRQAAFLVQYYEGGRPDLQNADFVSKVEQKYGDWFVVKIRKALAGGTKGPDWRKLMEDAWQRYHGHGVALAAAAEYGLLQADKMDIAQLAAKLTLNSLYGFTGIKIIMAILPMMMLAAATTATGRRVLEFTVNTSERVNARTMLDMFKEMRDKDTSMQRDMMEEAYEQAGHMLSCP